MIFKTHGVSLSCQSNPYAVLLDYVKHSSDMGRHLQENMVVAIRVGGVLIIKTHVVDGQPSFQHSV
jgi:hypothetical protein